MAVVPAVLVAVVPVVVVLVAVVPVVVVLVAVVLAVVVPAVVVVATMAPLKTKVRNSSRKSSSLTAVLKWLKVDVASASPLSSS